MEFKIEDESYPVYIIRKKNKNTYIRVKSGPIISVTTNRWVTKKQIKKILEQNISALKKMLMRCQREEEKKNRFYILGTIYDIIIVPEIKKIEISGTKIYTPTKRKLELWYKSEMRSIFEERLLVWYQKFEETIPKPILKIRTMKTRWGVCNIKDNSVTLNSRLMEYDREKLDYVIIHELSHFIHFNHSSNFWKLVEKYCPNYKKIRKSLKEE